MANISLSIPEDLHKLLKQRALDRDTTMSDLILTVCYGLVKISKPKRMRAFDATGIKYGMLTAMEYVGDLKWLFQCDCGNTKTLLIKHVKSGKTKSCGCLRINKGTHHES
jgi:hypothetical protein